MATGITKDGQEALALVSGIKGSGSLVYSDSSRSKQRVTDGKGCRSIQLADNLKEE